MTTPVNLRQPDVLRLSFLTSMCERFGFYVLSFILVLFAKAEYGLADTAAFSLFAVVTALAFMLPVIGGYVADNLFGIRRCITLGLFIEGLGLCLLAVPQHFMFPIALALVVIGEGLFKTTPTNLLGRSYEENDPRIDSGFTFYYMGMNIGGFSSAIFSGLLERYYGWHVAFFVAGLGVWLGLFCYFMFRKHAAKLDSPVGEKKLSPKAWGFMLLAIVVIAALCSFLLSHTFINDILFALVGIVLVTFFIFEIIKVPRIDKLRIVACLSLIFIGMVYYVLYFQAYTSMELFINRVVNKNVLGFSIPTEAYLGLNPVWIVILGPIMAFIYKATAKKFGKDITVTTKFGIGLLVVSLCFFSLVISSYFTNVLGQVSSWWLVLAFGLYTLGELLIGALGVAMVTRLVPKQMYGVTMGAWFFGTAVAALVSGWFASFASVADTETNVRTMLAIYSHAFEKIGIAGLIITVLVFMVGPSINRIANWK